MTIGGYIGIGAAVLILGLGALSRYLLRKNKDLKQDLEDEKERSQEFRKAMANSKDLSEKSNEIDKKIEEKKHERKRLSKSDKIAAANNRNSRG